MKKRHSRDIKVSIPDADEPIGIVISRGDRSEVISLFSAYVWGPAPEPLTEATVKVA